MRRFVLIVVGAATAIAGVAVVADFAGFPPPGAAIGGAIGGAVAAVLIARSRVKTGPRCSADLPLLRKPTSLKQALWGGWTCQKCGCEIGPRGEMLSPSVGRP